MSIDRRFFRVHCAVATLILVAVPAGFAAAADTAPPAGLRENTPRVHALVGARIVVAPGQAIEKATLVVRDGLIEAVGPDVATPPDARVWDVSGKTLYPGLIDAFSELNPAGPPAGAGYWNSNVVPQRRADELYAPDGDLNRKLRSQGVAVRLAAPVGGIVKGTSTLVTTGDDGLHAIVSGRAALHVQLQPSQGRESYPNSPMGAMALVRQALLDAGWYRQAWQTFNATAGVPRPEQNDALEALQHYPGSPLPVIVDAPNELYFLRADALAREFQLNVIVRGSGREYRRLDAVKATGRPVIVPLNFPDAPQVANPEAARGVSLTDLLHWDIAPENAGRLDQAGVRIALTSADKGRLLELTRVAIARGLDPVAALQALTVTPAGWFGVGQKLGTIEAGKAAHLVLTDGDLFGEKTKVLETWVDGQRYEVTTAPAFDLRGSWEVAIVLADGQSAAGKMVLEGDAGKPGGKLVIGDKESGFTASGLDDSRFHAAFKGEPLGWSGVVRLSVALSKDAHAELSLMGSVTWADGKRTACTAKKTPPEPPAQPPAEAQLPAESPAAAAAQPAPAGTEQKPPRRALFPVNYPLGAFGRVAPPDQTAVLLKNATVWTSGPQGILPRASILIEAGKIAAVGPDLPFPPGAAEIDLAGKHVSPGIIDCHSHIATDGGVNESGQTISAEVRIGDFIDPDDISIYRQLAGGVTGINILHGSANTIGGQTQVCKLRWGAGPEDLKLAGAPPGIKFALGENVKQSNWGDGYNTRYPQTRMGVEQLVVDAFQSAQHYRKKWAAWRQRPQGLPPRVDLELESLAEVLEGKRLIHCHSYRQDEILALLRTCDAFGVQIGTLQHILEGYKLADLMARQGVGGSTFSDWWAYKLEVYDAIPYNGALMHNAGVVVSFNSDFPELGRRLNLEAAKAVKYGGVSEAEALKFVTLNPAKQLRIDGMVGSIETGKDADLAVWSASPLSAYSRCEQTWIDGRKYFDREEDQQRRAEAERQRAALVQRILNPEG